MTENEIEVLRFIKHFEIEDEVEEVVIKRVKRTTPKIKELMAHTKLSKMGLYKILRRLKEKGLLIWNEGEHATDENKYIVVDKSI